MTNESDVVDEIIIESIGDGPSVRDVINETTPDNTTRLNSVLSSIDRFTSNLVTMGTLAAFGGLMATAAGWLMLKGYVYALTISAFAGTMFLAVPIGFAALCGLSFAVQLALQKRGVVLV